MVIFAFQTFRKSNTNIYIKTGTLRGPPPPPHPTLFNVQHQNKLTVGTLKSLHVIIQIIDLFTIGNGYKVALMLIQNDIKLYPIFLLFFFCLKLCFVIITSNFCPMLTSLWCNISNTVATTPSHLTNFKPDGISRSYYSNHS